MRAGRYAISFLGSTRRRVMKKIYVINSRSVVCAALYLVPNIQIAAATTQSRTPGNSARVCSHSQQCPECTSKRRKSNMVACELIVTSADPTDMFGAIEEAFDYVPSLVSHTAISTLGCSIRARRDDHLRASNANRCGKRIRIVPLSVVTAAVSGYSTNLFSHTWHRPPDLL